ncbi:Mur ligase [Mycena indigotica]|uniref:Mur ligase n=1 Tax=Mycena indigotica TaxID=2126181 RepID=A0A8H6SHC4_9AGAR|nr:Mur ligase [Mycena indigotica]KAF7298897.1 Mur ligase [Mycena indigotica]
MSIDLTLDRIQRLSQKLPAYTRPTCHIAGTNGKGSVAALVSSIFATCVKVGRFNSPHLISVHDSITINDETVRLDAYEAARAEVERLNEENETSLSSFEILTLTALLVFERAAVDVVVLEVGMGGRLDATNIIPDESVLVSALTAVDLDHQAFLGTTVSAIAAEKSAIARSGKPFVLGTQTHEEVENVVANAVTNTGAIMLYALPVFTRDWDTNIDGPEWASFSLSAHVSPPPTPVRFLMPCFDHPVHALLPLYGEHQIDNLALAVSVVSAALTSSEFISLRPRFTDKSIADGIKNTRWPGRLSFHSITTSTPLLVLADGAHNPASAMSLGAYLNELLAPLPKPISLTFILGLSYAPHKSPTDTLRPLFSLPNVKFNVALVQFSSPEGMPWVRVVPPVELEEAVKTLEPTSKTWVATERSQLKEAINWAASCQENTPSGLVVVAGSLYLIADFYRLLAEQQMRLD